MNCEMRNEFVTFKLDLNADKKNENGGRYTEESEWISVLIIIIRHFASRWGENQLKKNLNLEKMLLA